MDKEDFKTLIIKIQEALTVLGKAYDNEKDNENYYEQPISNRDRYSFKETDEEELKRAKIQISDALAILITSIENVQDIRIHSFIQKVESWKKDLEEYNSFLYSLGKIIEQIDRLLDNAYERENLERSVEEATGIPDLECWEHEK